MIICNIVETMRLDGIYHIKNYQNISIIKNLEKRKDMVLKILDLINLVSSLIEWFHKHIPKKDLNTPI